MSPTGALVKDSLIAPEGESLAWIQLVATGIMPIWGFVLGH
jgi:hypothetical protein